MKADQMTDTLLQQFLDEAIKNKSFTHNGKDYVIAAPPVSDGSEENVTDWKKGMIEELFEYLERCDLKATAYQRNIICKIINMRMDQHTYQFTTNERTELIEEVEKLNSVEIAVNSNEAGDGWFSGFKNCKKEVLALLNQKKED